jgi:gamma-glutamylaminecyclotransferase
MMSPTLVFVFGTLKQDFPNFHANRGVRVPGNYITAQRFPFYLVGERYSPWLIDQPGLGHQVNFSALTQLRSDKWTCLSECTR